MSDNRKNISMELLVLPYCNVFETYVSKKGVTLDLTGADSFSLLEIVI